MLRPLCIALLLVTACAPATRGTRMLTDTDPIAVPQAEADTPREQRVSVPEEPPPGGKTPRLMELDVRPLERIDPDTAQKPRPLPEEPRPPR
jgi:hypothetical protein